jgi:hypothetical protein
MKHSNFQSTSSTSVRLESMAIEMPPVEGHPNRVAFRGVLTFVGVPSDKAPAGAQGHRVLLTRTATERALPSLLGMALDYAPTLDRHDARRKVGIITRADLLPANKAGSNGRTELAASKDGMWQRTGVRNGEKFRAAAGARALSNTTAARSAGTATPRIDVGGYIFARDFPELLSEMRKGGPQLLGMSYEITDARIEDLQASIWTIREFLFTGAAVLRRDKAAYQNTWIALD